MIPLGVLLVLLAIAALGAAVWRGGGPAHIDLDVIEIDTTVLLVFLAGALALLLVVAGMSLIANGMRRARQRRKEVKELRQQADREPAPRRRESEPTVRPVERRAAVEEEERVVVRREPAETPRVRREGEAEGPDNHFESAPRER